MSNSIEDKLISISLRTLWVVIASVILAVWMAAMAFNTLTNGQQLIVSKIDSISNANKYDAMDIRKDIANQEIRITKLENK